MMHNVCEMSSRAFRYNTWPPSLPNQSAVLYRVMLVVWVEIDLGYYTTCWAAGVMAKWAEQVGLDNLKSK